MSRSMAIMKPELVLKRANDLINTAVGSNADKEKRMALEQIHNAICVKKKGVWSKTYENLMRRHIELCVDLKDHHTAKDGLHQYRNLCMLVDPNSLENVVLYLMELSENKAAIAKKKANQVAIAAAARVADLDQEESPESIMLSSMTEEGSIERTDREVVVPWLKFLWENYRAILELLYRLPKLEKVYHRACEKAFKFCLDYTRKMEFRRLCEMLRNQLANLQKPLGPNVRGLKPQWEWTPEAIEAHMQTRFSQLEAATTLELWNEGFRTIEDITGIMQVAKKAPKAKLMITYYERLSKIFWVADNKLFHAYALLKWYQWSTDKRESSKDFDKTSAASSVLLSALSVPSIKDIYAEVLVDDEDYYPVDKNAQLASLLDFHSNPSRQSLLNEIVAKGLLEEVSPELASLYDSLEVKFSPLNLVKSISECLKSVKNNSVFKQYAAPLERIIVVKVMQQLSRVYSIVKFDFVMRLLSNLDNLTAVGVERIILDAVGNKQLSLKINHSTKTINFSTTSSALASVDSQLFQLGSVLNAANYSLVSAQREKENRAAKKVFFDRVAEAVEAELDSLITRKLLIEDRKEGVERIQQEKQKEEKRQKELEEAKRKEDEEARLEKEEQMRLAEKKRKEQEERDVIRLKADLEKFGVYREKSDLSAMKPEERSALLRSAEADFRKTRDDEKRRLEDQSKRLDYMVRALRLESFDKVDSRQESQAAEDNSLFEEKSKEHTDAWKSNHAQRIEEKNRLSKAFAFCQAFEAAYIPQQQTQYNKERESTKKKMLLRAREANVAKARQLFEEEQERLEAERNAEIRRIEQEKQDRLEAERFEKLRLQKAAEEELEREREATLEKMRREIEEEEKRRKAATAQSSASAAAGSSASAEPAKTSGGGAYKPPQQRSSGAYVPPRPGGASGSGAYVPPRGRDSGDRGTDDNWRRGGGGGGGGDRRPQDSDRGDRRNQDSDKKRDSGGSWR